MLRSPRGQDLLRRDDDDTLKALKVLGVESQNPGDSMNVHRGHKAGIVGILANHLVTRDDSPPLEQYGRNVIA
jgi:hypothetical protein